MDAAVGTVGTPATPAAAPTATPRATPIDAPARPGAAFRDRVESLSQPEVEQTEGGQFGTDESSQVAEEFAAEPAPDMSAADAEQADALLGMPEADFLTKLREGEGVLPDEVLEKLKIKRMRDGVEETVSLADHRDDVLRHSDYSRKQDALRADRQEFKQTQSAFSGMVEGWKANPASMADDLELLGIDLEAVLAPVARMYAGEVDMTPRERDLARRVRESERRERMSLLRTRAEQSKLQGDKQQRQQAQMEQHVSSLRTPAFIQHKITDGPVARRIFDEHLRSLWDTGELNAKIAHSAALATREDLIRMAQEYSANGGKPSVVQPDVGQAQARRAPPPRGAAPGGSPAASTQRAGSPADFRAHIESLQTRRR